MYIRSEGIILRQVKALGGRRMISIFSKNYGKLSCGSSMSEGGKNKTALALRPFTYGRYELYSGRRGYNIQAAETVKSYYGIGEDIGKYMAACCVLELSDKVLPEEQPQPKMFMLLKEFFDMLEPRKTAFGTLVTAYQCKLLDIQGLRASEGLKSAVRADIIEILRYFEEHRIEELSRLALNKDTEEEIRSLLKEYFAVHLGVDKLKSEGLMI